MIENESIRVTHALSSDVKPWLNPVMTLQRHFSLLLSLAPYSLSASIPFTRIYSTTFQKGTFHTSIDTRAQFSTITSRMVCIDFIAWIELTAIHMYVRCAGFAFQYDFVEYDTFYYSLTLATACNLRLCVYLYGEFDIPTVVNIYRKMYSLCFAPKLKKMARLIQHFGDSIKFSE